MRIKVPMISVIIPTLQEEKYVATTLSHLVKINPQIEIIVADGGSEDNTVKIAKRYTDNVYKIDERGISKTKNYGAKKANGELLVFIDADVSIPTNFTEKVTETFKDNKVVGATCNIMPAQPRLIETIFFNFHNLSIRMLTWFPQIKFKHSRGEFIAVRKREFQKVGGFNESIACLEDHDFVRRLSELGKIVFIKNLTVYESMRRIRKLGLFKVVWLWSVNFLSYIIRGEPISKVWNPIR